MARFQQIGSPQAKPDSSTPPGETAKKRTRGRQGGGSKSLRWPVGQAPSQRGACGPRQTPNTNLPDDPDCFEDKNGNGTVDSGESDWRDADTDDDGLDDGLEMSLGTHPIDPDTDHDGLIDGMEQQHDQSPLNPDTDNDGWPDGAELAEELLLFLHSYQLNASRDFITVPRSPALPDAVVTMNWWHDQASTMDVTGDMSECYENPQPEDAKSDGTEYRWPGSGSGTSQYWKITFGNPAKQYSSPEQSDRPPSQQIEIPWERCSNLSRTNSTTNSSFYGSFSRSALAPVHLKSDAPTWPKPKRSVVLSCSASDMSGDPDLPSLLSVTAFSSGSRMGEPNTSPGGIDIARTNIVVDGRRASPGGDVLVQVNKVGEKDVTPTVKNVTWFRYSLSKAEPKPVLLTWSYHPAITNNLPDLQAAFDAGAQLLASDDDGPGTNEMSDGVSAFREFFLLPARTKSFPGPFGATNYLHIRDNQALTNLLAQEFSNIKIVASIVLGGEQILGAAWFGMPSILLTTDLCTGKVAMHEFGHCAGLDDRDDDSQMIMFEAGATGCKITRGRSEQERFQNYEPHKPVLLGW